jgi:hypothetical protein
MNINEINQTIMFGKLTNEQLNSIISAIKYARGELAKQARYAYNVGDSVKFVGKSGGYEVGRIVKMNRKRFVIEVGYTRWNVPMNLVSAA